MILKIVKYVDLLNNKLINESNLKLYQLFVFSKKKKKIIENESL